ncbi:hypothetical protein N0V90_012835 [Kalmusia sp. IMI 367209]|nr:hypothetical protein N0V90_012835 [Kalmusia sp. IMI 367209]
MAKRKKAHEPLAWLRTNNGVEIPVYHVIPGFEQYFLTQTAPRSSRSSKVIDQPYETQAICPLFNLERGKRKRDDSCHSLHVLQVGNIEHIEHFYAVRLTELNTRPLHAIVTAWVKKIEPLRQKKYGHYDTSKMCRLSSTTRPIWWPNKVPYFDPAHLKREDLITLAVSIMLVHRHIDDKCGKRKHFSWIKTLERIATYILEDTATEKFSTAYSQWRSYMKTTLLSITYTRAL